MDSTDTNLKKTSNIEQMALIGKMHNMQWLKSNSQLSGHAKTIHPVPDGKDTINHTAKIKINEGVKEKAEVIPSNAVTNRLELDKLDPTLSIDTNESECPVNKNTLRSAVEIVEFPQKNMETVWNKDVNASSTLFPNSQPLSMQRLDDKELISMSLAENIVAVQLEQFRLNEDEKNKSNELCNEDDNEWDNVHRNVSDVPKSDSDISNKVGSKQCHDNNNNNAKSKSQLPFETKKTIQRTNAKIGTKKLGDQKIRKQGGTSLKESNVVSLKQSSKFKDDSINVCNDNNISSTSTDSKKITVGTTPKFVDKYGRANGYNKNLIMGKGARMKEQPFLKEHFSTLNDNGNRNRSSTEGLDEKSKPVAAKLKLSRIESDKRTNEIDDAKRCHKVQITRTQSYNVQYNRNKPLIKSQQRYLRNSTKLDEDCSINSASGFNNSITMSTLTENASKKKCENQQPVINKNVSDSQSNQNTSGKTPKNSDVPECSTSEKDSIKSSLPNNCKRNYQNVPNTKNSIDRNIKDDRVYAQRFKKDSNVYRRTSGIVHTYFKDLNGKTKAEDQKRNVTDTNLTKDYRVNRMTSVDPKVRSQPEGSRITVYPQKTSNGAGNISKTDTLDSTAANNVQSVKSLNSCSSSTKDSMNINTSTRTSQESQVLHASCNETEVQFVKTEQEDTSINNSNNKASNSEAKSVKFSDNVQEFNIAHSATSYSDNSIQHSRLPANSFYPDLQTANTNNAQPVENYHAVQNKSYIDNNNAQYNNTSINIQNTERGDLHALNTVQQKPEQTSHVSPQNMLPQHNCNQTISVGNSLPYQNMPTVYLNQYNNTQAVPRKTADGTVITQSSLIPSTSSYTIDTQNIVQSDPSNILMHNTQTSILPPPGFHGHPITAQHNQWNLPIPEMFVYGNVINPAHPLNMPIQNSRHVCNTEYNNIQQPGYVQQPLFYVPPLCMQGWNPILQYSAPIFQNPSYSNCNTFPNQVLSASNMTDSMNCQVPTSMQNNPYKHYQQVQSLENPPNFSVPVKLDNYMGNMQGCKSNNVRMKDNAVDVHMRASQYRAPVPNEYQNCSQQDAQLMIPYSYAVTMDSIARNAPSNMNMQMNQKYAPRAPLTTANYPRMAETCSVFHNNQDSNNRNNDSLKNDSEFIPPIVSPRECMYYGVNYSRKTDSIQNSSVRQDVKPVTYMHGGNSQHYVPQYQKNATYHAPPKDHSSRITTGRGMHRTMEQ